MDGIKISNLDTVNEVEHDDLAISVVDLTTNGTKNISIGNLAKSLTSKDADNLLENDTNGLIKADADNFISDNDDNGIEKGSDEKLFSLKLFIKYHIWGFIPSSGSTPDEEVSITKGEAICEDGSTIVKLTSNEVDLDLPTLKGSSLSNNTTYHLFRFKKDDDTYQWWLDTSLTPTITDIKSALAYRRIYSAKTDNSGDLPDVFGNLMSGGGIRYTCKDPISVENASSSSTTQTTILLQTPLGLKINVEVMYAIINSDPPLQLGRIYSLDSNDLVVSALNANLYPANAGTTASDGSIIKKIRSNLTSQIARRELTNSGIINTTIHNYEDLRNYY